ncbi:LysR substrate-binding domain-containing protein [Kiloniella laminariae]|uniref:LysR substrate-binding domain-containing protein n=1 Tax=Kiloniella laminariae TaxID=454162 RepID=A0ABT4LK36_9PROT|nr:LysR substrate-binding domain-containing protein [Kiloniella laminariae]MCZ4281458.1 LysR substrate-binding domain-containing protein [Kiloniella laminariae]
MNRSGLPPLNALRAFEATARRGRMIDAANELNVTYGAISKQVRHLESVLAVPLFEGPRNCLKLTTAGQKLLPQLTMAFDLLEQAVESVSEQKPEPLDIACIGTFMMRWLLPRLHRFSVLHPETEVRMRTLKEPASFGPGGYDLAIVVGAMEDSARFNSTPLFEETVGPVMTAEFAERYFVDCARVFPSELPLLHTLTRKSAWQDWALFSGIRVLQAEEGTEFEHFYFMLEGVLGGLGAAIAPWVLVSEDVKAGRLVAPFGFVSSGQTYRILSRAGSRSEEKQRKKQAFVSWIAAEAEASPLWRGEGALKDNG